MSRACVLRVGLTGNIGAGKTTVGALLEEAGCLVVDLDRLGHELIAEPGSPAVAEIEARFGAKVLDQSGRVDRAALARLVFGDAAELQALEAILHPRIRALERERVRDWSAAQGIAVTEAALLVETGGHTRYHRLVVVTAPDDVRLERIVQRGMARAEAESRMAAQMAQEFKAGLADYVIDNGGDLPTTQSAVRQLLLRLRQDLDDLARGVA